MLSTDPGWYCLAMQLCRKGPVGAAGGKLSRDLLRKGWRTGRETT